jgi:hypothetical protein
MYSLFVQETLSENLKKETDPVSGRFLKNLKNMENVQINICIYNKRFIFLETLFLTHKLCVRGNFSPNNNYLTH